MGFVMLDLELAKESLPLLGEGVLLTMGIAGVASGVGLALGTLLALAQVYGGGVVARIITGWISLFRGTPILVQILFFFYVLPELGVRLPGVWLATLAIGLNSSAYISQIVRTGIVAIPRGQFDAARALGLGPIQAVRLIVLPQAFQRVLPALASEFATLIKDSSLASVIGVVELTKQASIIRSRTYDAFTLLIVVSCLYLAMTALISYLVQSICRKESRNGAPCV